MKYLKIKTLSSKYTDKDNLLLHAAFQILVDFVELEKPNEFIDWDHDDEYIKIWKEITELYTWWTKIRPNYTNLLDDKTIEIPPLEYIPVSTHAFQIKHFNDKKYKKYYKACKDQYKLDIKLEKEDQKNLLRLIKIRPYLWT